MSHLLATGARARLPNNDLPACSDIAIRGVKSENSILSDPRLDKAEWGGPASAEGFGTNAEKQSYLWGVGCFSSSVACALGELVNDFGKLLPRFALGELSEDLAPHAVPCALVLYHVTVGATVAAVDVSAAAPLPSWLQLHSITAGLLGAGACVMLGRTPQKPNRHAERFAAASLAASALVQSLQACGGLASWLPDVGRRRSSGLQARRRRPLRRRGPLAAAAPRRLRAPRGPRAGRAPAQPHVRGLRSRGLRGLGGRRRLGHRTPERDHRSSLPAPGGAGAERSAAKVARHAAPVHVPGPLLLRLGASHRSPQPRLSRPDLEDLTEDKVMAVADLVCKLGVCHLALKPPALV